MPDPNSFLRALALITLLAGVGEAAGVRGRLVVTGVIPPPAALDPGRDACCQDAAPIDQSLRVGEAGGLAGVLVSVEPRRGDVVPPSGTVPSEPVELTNRGCAFEPRVLIVRTGQPLVLANADPTMHNVNLAFARNAAVNVVVEPGGRRELVLLKPERKPVGARCNVHTFMKAWVVVREDQHGAITDESGGFALSELPAGTWRLRFWHEGRVLSGLSVGSETTDKRGEAVLIVPSEGLDLGEIRIQAEELLPAK